MILRRIPIYQAQNVHENNPTCLNQLCKKKGKLSFFFLSFLPGLTQDQWRIQNYRHTWAPGGPNASSPPSPNTHRNFEDYRCFEVNSSSSGAYYFMFSIKYISYLNGNTACRFCTIFNFGIVANFIYQGTDIVNQGLCPGRPWCRYATAQD